VILLGVVLVALYAPVYIACRTAYDSSKPLAKGPPWKILGCNRPSKAQRWFIEDLATASDSVQVATGLGRDAFWGGEIAESIRNAASRGVSITFFVGPTFFSREWESENQTLRQLARDGAISIRRLGADPSLGFHFIDEEGVYATPCVYRRPKNPSSFRKRINAFFGWFPYQDRRKFFRSWRDRDAIEFIRKRVQEHIKASEPWSAGAA
jgi:hypothetical protein